MHELKELLEKVRACKNCEKFLPFGARPVLRINPSAKLLIIGQAPGTKVHASGIPWNDRSGDQLRNWLALDKTIFYNEEKIAIIPMGLCYPGTNKKGEDNPPRPECAPLWHKLLLDSLPNLKLILLVGGYSQRYYLGKKTKSSVWVTVQSWREYLPEFFPLPHPSWRNTTRLRKNDWFYQELLSDLRERVIKTLNIEN